MTVAELIEQLQQLNPKALVMQSSDGENNRYSPTAEATVGLWTAESTWSGDFWTPELDDDEPMLPEPGVDVHAVCLWPTN